MFPAKRWWSGKKLSREHIIKGFQGQTLFVTLSEVRLLKTELKGQFDVSLHVQALTIMVCDFCNKFCRFMQSEHTKGILMRNLIYIVRFSRLTVRFSTLLPWNTPFKVKNYKDPDIQFWKSHMSFKYASWKFTTWMLFLSIKQWRKTQRKQDQDFRFCGDWKESFWMASKRTALKLS